MGAASKNAASLDAPPPITQTTETPAAYAPPSDFSPFQAPLISSLERGKWYVQLGVYTRPDNVEDEIIRIGSAYPVAIQNIGTDTSPMFRVLLGPLNQGESGAMLQRFKSIGYADAFVRYN
jgi:cell division septation protein DedD